MIIRGGVIQRTVILTDKKELYYEENGSGAFLEQECSDAFKKGEEQGERGGYQRAIDEMHGMVLLIHKLSERLIDQKVRLLDQMKPEIIEFALSVCERVIRKELSRPEILVHLINSLLTFAASELKNNVLEILLAPEDLLLLENFFGQIHYDKKEIKNVRFRADALMKRGDCRIEAPLGLLNYMISRELADLQSQVMQEKSTN